jgi:hypothetical protein
MISSFSSSPLETGSMNIYVLEVDNTDWTRLAGSWISKFVGDHRNNRFPASLDLRDARIHHRTFARLVSLWNYFVGLAVRSDNLYPVTKTNRLPTCHSQWSQVPNGAFGLKDLCLSDSIEHGLAAEFQILAGTSVSVSYNIRSSARVTNSIPLLMVPRK